VFLSAPRSLEFPRHPPEAAPVENPGFLRSVILRLGGYYSRESRLMRGAEGLYAGVKEQADDPSLAAALRLPPGFQPHHALLCLHVWLLLVRLRAEGKDGKALAQTLYDEFQEDVEARVRRAGIKVRLSKQLTELERQFYGSSMAYDAAMGVPGASTGGRAPESLASALQRNVFEGDEAAAEAATGLERYCKREMACLAMTPSEAVLAGNLRFTPVGGAGGAAAARPAARAQPTAGSPAVL
jgi:cytochrome b pre-mRNA-processing protein 3